LPRALPRSCQVTPTIPDRWTHKRRETPDAAAAAESYGPRMALQTYLVEDYRPGYTAERLEQWAASVRVAAAGIAREGKPVRYLGPTIVPTVLNGRGHRRRSVRRPNEGRPGCNCTRIVTPAAATAAALTVTAPPRRW
jgi:hypothetical protein